MSVRQTATLRRALFVAAAVSAASFFATAAQAAQFLLVDHSYTHVKETHHYGATFSPELPSNLASPVDYRDATFHFRFEIKKKPNNTIKIAYQSCLIGQNGYICSNPYGPRHQTPGVYEWSEEVTRFYKNGTYDLGQKPREIHLIVKDKDLKFPEVPKNGGTPDYEGAPDLSLYYPMEVRFTVWVVKKGDKFEPNLPGAPVPADAGVADGGARDGGSATIDAGESARRDAAADVRPEVPPAQADAAVATPSEKADAAATTKPDARPQPGPDVKPTTTKDDEGGARSSGCAYGGGVGGDGLGLAVMSCLVVAVLLRRRRTA